MIVLRGRVSPGLVQAFSACPQDILPINGRAQLSSFKGPLLSVAS
jgi:hypothetical protein